MGKMILTIPEDCLTFDWGCSSMKILMVGNKESGKTTYMASAFGLLASGIEGFNIECDYTTRNWFEKLYQAVKNGKYPVASDKRDEFFFKLSCFGTNVLDFSWIDYNGGVIREMDADKLMTDIKECDGVMLFFDAVALRDNAASIHQLRRILTLLSKKLGEIEVPLFSVILVVTKTDLLRSTDEYMKAVAPLNNFLENVSGNDDVYARVVPVSCTSNGFYNAELPLLDVLDSGLKIAYLTAAYQAQKHAEQAIEYSNKRGIGDWIFSKLSGLPTNGELAESELKVALAQKQLFESIEGPTERLSTYVQDYTIKMPWELVKAMPQRKNSSGRRLIDF